MRFVLLITVRVKNEQLNEFVVVARSGPSGRFRVAPHFFAISRVVLESRSGCAKPWADLHFLYERIVCIDELSIASLDVLIRFQGFNDTMNFSGRSGSEALEVPQRLQQTAPQRST